MKSHRMKPASMHPSPGPSTMQSRSDNGWMFDNRVARDGPVSSATPVRLLHSRAKEQPRNRGWIESESRKGIDRITIGDSVPLGDSDPARASRREHHQAGWPGTEPSRLLARRRLGLTMTVVSEGWTMSGQLLLALVDS